MVLEYPNEQTRNIFLAVECPDDGRNGHRVWYVDTKFALVGRKMKEFVIVGSRGERLLRRLRQS